MHISKYSNNCHVQMLHEEVNASSILDKWKEGMSLTHISSTKHHANYVIAQEKPWPLNRRLDKLTSKIF